MNKYIILYSGGDKPSSPDAGRQHFAKYQQWLQALGSDVLEPMVPYGPSRTISADRTVAEQSLAALSGHTVIQAASLQDAVKIASDCPFLDTNGRLEVAELVQMPKG